MVGADAGWYACAEEGVEIDNYFKNLNHSHKEISWIHVSVYIGALKENCECMNLHHQEALDSMP